MPEEAEFSADRGELTSTFNAKLSEAEGELAATKHELATQRNELTVANDKSAARKGNIANIKDEPVAILS